MQTPWIPPEQLERTLARHEAFWDGELDDSPLLWITVPDAIPGPPLPEPATDDALWTDVDYRIAATEHQLARTHYAGDSLPVFHPWLGPDQFAAWLGADLTLQPRETTSWITPFVKDWDDHPELTIDPANRWWTLYLETVRASVAAGRDKWVTGYPDLHTGIDGLAAIRGPDNLMMDLMLCPDKVHRAMRQTTALWTSIMETVSDLILPTGQGTSNWTMGWSRRRFSCLGQNDFSCLIGPQMFVDFCWEDTRTCCDYLDCAMYHLDGPDGIRHLPKILELENLHTVQWIQGASQPLPSQWIPLLRTIQQAGKAIQLLYTPGHGDHADLVAELDVLCQNLDPTRLFIYAVVQSVERSEAIVEHARRICRGR